MSTRLNSSKSRTTLLRGFTNLSLQSSNAGAAFGNQPDRRAMLVRHWLDSQVIPPDDCRAAPVEVFYLSEPRICGGLLFQRLLNPRRGAIGRPRRSPTDRSGRLEAVPLDHLSLRSASCGAHSVAAPAVPCRTLLRSARAIATSSTMRWRRAIASDLTCGPATALGDQAGDQAVPLQDVLSVRSANAREADGATPRIQQREKAARHRS